MHGRNVRPGIVGHHGINHGVLHRAPWTRQRTRHAMYRGTNHGPIDCVPSTIAWSTFSPTGCTMEHTMVNHGWVHGVPHCLCNDCRAPKCSGLGNSRKKISEEAFRAVAQLMGHAPLCARRREKTGVAATHATAGTHQYLVRLLVRGGSLFLTPKKHFGGEYRRCNTINNRIGSGHN